MKRLILMRHAKSSWRDVSLSDFQRPLNKRGMRDAPEMGRRLHRRRLIPDRILSSSAERAWSTALLVAVETGFPVERIETRERLYLASGKTLLEAVQGTDEGCDTLLLVAHNPGITELSNRLGDARTDNLPTAAQHAIDLPVEHWREVATEMGKTLFLDWPKNDPGL
ncbi:MAG TPA: histidine phosphatase family protein [Thiotrichales bacterium]|nr:histidine phosphatase family protein [Thiotrichales bacterium]